MTYEFTDKLNFKINKENYIKDLQELFNKMSNEAIVLRKNDVENYVLECSVNTEVREKEVSIYISVCFDSQELKTISLVLVPEENDEAYYDSELKLFYFEKIKGKLLDAVNSEKNSYTLRCYKRIYNSFPIQGLYEINYDGKCLFHTLYEIEKNEPLTEHILVFDVDISARSFEEARSKTYNKIAEVSDFLSVLIDVGIYDPFSTFSNFVTTKMQGVHKCYATERYRTAFIDTELDLLVKDNMNGLCPRKEAEQKNFLNGYYSLALYSSVLDSSDSICQFKAGNTGSIEKNFENHRLYKVKKDNKSNNLYRDGIDSNIHFANQRIEIPREVRSFYRGIAWLKKTNINKYNSFRNASRLYNKSKIIGMNDGSMEISLLVACIEALAKSESGVGFTNFVLKYNNKANRDSLDDMYGIRSKLFHAGEFSFFEYCFDVNPYCNPIYKEFQDKYFLYKMILRTTIVNWIYQNIITNDKEDDLHSCQTNY